MSFDKTVAAHYTHGDLLGAIEVALAELGKPREQISVADLAPVDEFHIGGRSATDHILSRVDFASCLHVLDVGCGLGGASRYIANKYKNHTTGIDLTKEYIDVGNTLCTWVGLEHKVTLMQGSALDMPFENENFDGAIMLHVGMNIADKSKLFKEVYRVLRPGASFAVYDVMQIQQGELSYPVPWASQKETSMLASPGQYKHALADAGFKVLYEQERRDFAVEFFKQVSAYNKAHSGPPALGLHTLMQQTAPIKINNMINNINAGLVAPVEIVAQK